MWRVTAGDGVDIVAILNDVLAEFETAAAQNKSALEITCEDVAAYCDDHLGEVNPYDRYLQKWRTSLIQDVKRQL